MKGKLDVRKKVCRTVQYHYAYMDNIYEPIFNVAELWIAIILSELEFRFRLKMKQGRKLTGFYLLSFLFVTCARSFRFFFVSYQAES